MATEQFRDGDLFVDFRSCRIWLDDREISTSAIRFRILTHLVDNAGKPLSSKELMQHAWEGAQYDLGLVRWHIARLRKELGDVPPKRIIYVRGFGYRFDTLAPLEPSILSIRDDPEIDHLKNHDLFHCSSRFMPDAQTVRHPIRPLRCLRYAVGD